MKKMSAQHFDDALISYYIYKIVVDEDIYLKPLGIVTQSASIFGFQGHFSSNCQL